MFEIQATDLPMEGGVAPTPYVRMGSYDSNAVASTTMSSCFLLSVLIAGGAFFYI